MIHKMCEGGKTKHRYSFEANANQSKEEGAGIIVEQCLPSRLAFDRILNEVVHHGKSKKGVFQDAYFRKKATAIAPGPAWAPMTLPMLT